jgi:formylglycine-generating enzyme required for sulfatase activity
MKTIGCILSMLILAGFLAPLHAQNVSIPDPGLDAAIRAALQKPIGSLTPQDLLGLTTLNAESRSITNLQGLEAARNLANLDLQSNHLANLSFTNGLTNLKILNLSFNPLGRLALPADMTKLIGLELFSCQLTNLAIPAGLTNLIGIDLEDNRLSNFNLPANFNRLDFLIIAGNQLTNIVLPAGLTSLSELHLEANRLVNFTLPPDATNLIVLDLFFNELTNVTLPEEMRNLSIIDLDGNRLTNLTLPAGLTNLGVVSLNGNNLANLNLPAGLTHLTFLDLNGNLLTNLTLPPDLTRLTSLFVNGNPLTTLVLSEPLASSNLAAIIPALEDQGVSVFEYPLSIQLIRLPQPGGAFQFGITGPPGVYSVLGSTNLAIWSVLGATTNTLGIIAFTDIAARLAPQKFYRAQLQSVPANLVFIPPTTFTLGSPANEPGHQPDESPQTIVTLSHGFWMSKFLVTQREYLAVSGFNPSGFPGDLNRPVESVSWFAASNYCAQLTKQDLTAGRIPPGSHYRLPTEAEWECAARAGTSTRFYFDDDAASLTNRAWYGVNSGFTPHPVGLKPPNAWGLYDMEGNVWEWCQDWYGPYPGGSKTDPQGPASNATGVKVIRGGAWESFESDCRSARRSTEGASPFISDFIIGFRVVLAVDP